MPHIKERLHFHATKIRQHPFVVDNISRGKAHLLILSNKIKSAVPTKEQARDFWREHHHRMVYIAVFFIFCAITIHINAHAEVDSANLYASTCVGDWQHPERASGAPDVLDGNTDFSSENSSVISGSPSNITCKNFSGNIPEGVAPKKFVVHLSWVATAEPIEDANTLLKDDTILAPVQDEISAPDASVNATTTDSINSTDSTDATSTDTQAATSSESSPTSADTTSENQQKNIVAMTTDLPAQDFLELRYTLDGEHWNNLGAINASNAKNISFEIQNTDITKWSDLSNIQISVGTLLTDDQLPHIYVDSVYLEADYATIPKITNPPKISLKDGSAVLDGKSDFGSDETPTFVVSDPGLTTGDIQTLVDANQAVVIEDLRGIINTTPASSAADNPVDFKANVIDSVIQNVQQKVQETTDSITSYVTTPVAQAAENSATIQDAQVLDSFGNVTDIPVVVSDVVVNGIQKQQVAVTKPSRAFRPGKYTLELSLDTAQAVIVSKQDFTWGVLTLNTDKSIYAQGDTAFLQMGVINDLGHTICDADLALTITGPDGTKYPFASANNSIATSGDCNGDTYVTTPDYSAYFEIPKKTGQYAMSLTATTANGTRTILSHFTVQDNAMFDVVRTGPTRIYPASAYPVSLQITPTASWSGTVIEKVPANFDISPASFSTDYDSIETSSDGASKIISWKLSLEANKKTTIGYYFNAPKISPEFYLLGPLEFKNDLGETIFSETRQWQIADDAVCTATLSGTWSTVNTGSMWSGCTGVGGVPGTADDVTINPSVTVTLGVATPVVNSLTINGTLNTSLSNFALNTKSLSVPSGGILTANASVITVSGTTNSILSIVGTFNKGTSTMTLTGGSTATTIPAVSYYNLTLNNSLDTYLLTGTSTVIDPAGTLNITNGTLNTTVSNYAITAGKISISSVATAILTANGSIITLNATSGVLFTKGPAGVFNVGTSSIVVISDAAVTVFSANVTAANNVTLSPALTINRVYTMGAPALVLTGNFNITPSGTGLLTVNSSNSITVPVAKTFLIQPSVGATAYFDTVAVGNSISAGTLDIESGATLNVSAASPITLTGTSGTPFVVNGTFNAGAGTVTYSGDNAGGSTTIATNFTYFSLTINNSTETYILSGALTGLPGGTLTITNGTLDTTVSNYSITYGRVSMASAATAIFTANGSTITLNGTTGVLFVKGAAGIFNSGTSTIVMNPDAAITLFTGAATLNNLTISPVLTTNRTYTFSGGVMTINGNFNITPSGTGLLTVNMTSGVTAITVNAGKTFLLQPSGSATVYFDTVAAAQTISAGTLDIESGSTLNVSGGSAITLTGTTGTPFVMNGTFNAGTGVFTYNGNNAAGNTTITTNVTYYSLTVNNTAETYVLGGNLTISTLGTITITLGTLDTSSVGNYSITAGKMNLANSVSAILNLNASTVTLNATSGTLFTKGVAGVMNPGTSTVVIVSDAAITVFSGIPTLYNLTFSPVLTTSRAYIPGVSGALSTTGNFVINPSGTGTLTFTLTAGVTTLSVAATKTLSISGTGSALGLLDTSGSGQSISTGILDLEAGGTLNANQSVITLTGTTGTSFVMNGTFNQGTSTVTYTGDNLAGNTTVTTNVTYFNVILNKSGETFVLGGALGGAAGGTLTITAGTLDTTSSNYAITFGHLSVGAAGSGFLGNNSTLTLTGTTGTLYSRNNASTITTPNMDVVVTGDGAVSVFTGTGVYSFDNLTLSPTLTANRIYSWSTPSLTLNNLYVTPSAASTATLTVNMSTTGFTVAASGTFLIQPAGSASVYWDTSVSNPGISSGSIDVEANATLNANGSTFTITGTSLTPFVMNGTFNQGTSTVSFTGTSTGAALPAITYYNLTLNKTGSMVMTGTTTVVTAATLTITSGTFDTSASGNYSLIAGHISMGATTSVFNANSSTITLTGISGTLFAKVNAATFNAGTSEVIVTSASGNPALLVSGGNNLGFYKLTIDSTASSINTVGSLIMSSTNAGNKLWVKNGTLNDTAVTITGTTNGQLQVDDGATLCIGGTNGAGCVSPASGSVSTFPTNYTNANITMGVNSTVDYINLSNMTVSAVPTYGNLILNPTITGSRTYTFTSGTININGNFTISPVSSGVFGLTVTLAGALNVATGKTITISGSGAGPASGTLDTTASNYAVSTGSMNIASGGILNARSSNITVAENWTNAGTFTQVASTVILNTPNTAVVTGTTTFYKLTITATSTKEVDFATSGTPIFNVTNLFTVSGQAGGVMQLRSITPGVQWEFHPTGTSNVRYADVSDGGCQSGSITMITMGGTDSGNNDVCWAFNPFLSFDISSSTVGFGSLTSIGPRYATADGTGSSTDVEGNNITINSYAAGGYTLTVQGLSLGYSGYLLAGMGDSNIASIPGAEQFGIRAIATGGSGVVQTPYSGSSGTGGFASDADVNPSIIASESSGDGIPTTYSMHYIANISPSTPAGKYTTTLTYILTGTF